MKPRAYLLMTFVVAVWGATFVLIKSALADASPVAFNLVRMSLAFLVLLTVYGRSLRGIRAWQVFAGCVVGVCLAAGYQFQTIGLSMTTPSRSAFLTGLLVVMVPLFSAVPVLRLPGARAPKWEAYAGAALAFAGIVLLTSPASGTGLLPDWHAMNRGDLLTLGCAVSFALHCIVLGKVSPRVDFRSLAIIQVGACAVFMAASLPLLEHPRVNFTPRLVIALLIAAVLATAAAFAIQSWTQSILPPSHTALILTLEPVFAWLTSFVVLGERLAARPAFGAVLIMAGIALTELVPMAHPATAHEG